MDRNIITQVSVEPVQHDTAAWTVEAIGFDGEIYQAIFAGPDAMGRAYEYARLKFDFSPGEGLQRRSS